MPNHITNRLTINGSPDEVKKVLEAIGSMYEDGSPMYIDFNKIKPMPESLNIASGTTTDTGYALYQLASQGMANVRVDMWAYNRIQHILKEENFVFSDAGIQSLIHSQQGQELYELGKTAYDNLQQYGATTWYDWCINEWGTKWNAYDQSLEDNTLTFLTAWAGVPELLQQLAVQYPDVELEYMYADEDWGQNTGEFTFKGEEVHADIPSGGSPEARAIAEELLGPPWHEEDEDELEQ